MKRLALDEWEKKYINGTVHRFDQKYTLFNRTNWDPEVKGLIDDWSTGGAPRDKAGFRLEEMALRMASDRASRIFSLINTSKPNSKPLAHKIMATISGTNTGIPGSDKQAQQPKIDASNTARMSRIVKKVASYFGADIVGICRLDRRWVYSHTATGQIQPLSLSESERKSAPDSIAQEIPEEYKYVVVMGFEMEYDMFRYYSSTIATAATGMGYARMDFTNALLSEYIRNLGYKVIDCARNDVALSIPLAMQAGLGDIGRNGLLITPRFGPRLRLSKVITDLPLETDAPVDFGVTEFCQACQKCARFCPSRSILPGNRTDHPRNVSNGSGVLKWPINAVTCRMYWAQAKRGGGCGICISCCPYNKPDTRFHRAVRWFTDNLRWADSFYVTMDDWLGYGKPRRPDNFWDEWRPNGNHQ